MISPRIVFLALAVSSCLISTAKAQELDARVIKFLETISKYKSVQFETDFYSSYAKAPPSRPRQGGLPLLKRYDGIFDIARKAYRFREITYLDEGSKTLIRHRSWFDGVLQEFQDPSSSSFESKREAGGGTIVNQDYQTSNGPASPLLALGFDTTAVVGTPIHLWDLISKKNQTVTAQESFLIENIFDWELSFGAAYDLEFELSEKNDCLPKSLRFWDRTFGKNADSKTLFAEVQVQKFGKIGDLWVPIEYLHTGRGFKVLVIMDIAKIKLNQEYTKNDFQLSFPTDHWYVDQRTRIKHEGGKEIQLEPLPDAPSLAESTASSFPNVRWIVILSVLSAVAILSLLVAKQRGLLSLIMILGVLSCGGGDLSGDIRGSKKYAITNESEILIVGGDNQYVRIPIGGEASSTLFKIEIENTGTTPIELSPNIRTTCGCMEAFVEEHKLGPNKKTFVVAKVENARIPGDRTVQLTLTCLKPQRKEIPIVIETSFEGDWYVDRNDLTVTGVIGTEASQKITVFGTSKSLINLGWNASNGVEITETPSTRQDARNFTVRAKINELFNGHSTGKVRFSTEQGQPPEAIVVVRKFGKRAFTWNPIAISLKPTESKSVEFTLAEGVELKSIESEDFLVEWGMFEERTGRVTIRQKEIGENSESNSQRGVHAIVRVEENEQDYRLPVMFERQQDE